MTTAPRPRRTRRAGRLAALPVAAATALSLAGCGHQPSVAAYVGSDSVSVSSFQDLVRGGLTNVDVKTVVGSNQDQFRRAVLQTAVDHLLISQAAARAGVHASAAELEALRKDLSGGQQPLDALLAGAGVAPGQTDQFLTDYITAAKLAWAKHGTRAPVALHVGVIQLPKSGANAVQKALAAGGEGGYADVAKRYPGALTSPRVLTTTPAALAGQVGKPTDATFTAGDTFVERAPASGSSKSGGTALIYVFAASQPDLATLDAQTAVSELGTGFQAAAKHGFYAGSTKVRVNPRFGRWDAATHRITDSGQSVVTLASTPAS